VLATCAIQTLNYTEPAHRSKLADMDMPDPALRTVLDRIGNTALVPLRRLGPRNGSRLLLKLEDSNPTGSIKDRMALAMIEAAEADGRLQPDGRVVEYTGGSTGVSLALVCAVKGYHLDIVSSDAFAADKLAHMRALGAKVHVIVSDQGRMTEKLTRDMIEAARIITADTAALWTDQLNNTDQLRAYHMMADEIWSQTDGELDAFVQIVGTGASLRGNAERLRKYDSSITVVAIEPAESAVLSGRPTGAHKIDGVGAGFVVPLWYDEVADAIELVSTEDAKAMTLRLAQEEGLLAGTSTGANVLVALRMAERLPPNSTIVTVMCDTGMKYLTK
jgi:cysteine synthase